MGLKIGFDFDGVIANTPKLKMRYAVKEFGIYIHASNCTKKGFLENGLTEEKYARLQGMVYSSYDMEPVFNSLKYLKKLIDSNNYDISIISYRKKEGEKFVKHFLDKYSLNLQFICTDNQPKGRFCSNLDVFVDDRAEHLNNLSRKARHLFLFDTPYNKQEETNEIIKRVYGWDNLYREIRGLGREA
jgi:uncharacterized HAD superfamily protein